MMITSVVYTTLSIRRAVAVLPKMSSPPSAERLSAAMTASFSVTEVVSPRAVLSQPVVKDAADRKLVPSLRCYPDYRVSHNGFLSLFLNFSHHRLTVPELFMMKGLNAAQAVW
jgi:hypothetical protein